MRTTPTQDAREREQAVVDEAVRSAARRRRRWALARKLGALAIVVVSFVVVLPRVANYSEVWAEVRELDPPQFAILVVVTLLNLATYAPPWMAALPGLGFRRAFVVTQASTASTYIAPGGAAVGAAFTYSMLRAWGYGRAEVALAVALAGTWNQCVTFGLPLVGLGLLTLAGAESTALKTAAFVGLAGFVATIVIVVLALSSDSLARRIGDSAARSATSLLRRLRRDPVRWSGERLVTFRRGAIALLRRRWLALTAATIAGQITVFVVLVACLRVFGVSADEVSLIEAFAAWALIRLVSAVPITPGGVGLVEAGLTTLLVGFGGQGSEVAAAVLVYRCLTVAPTLALGLLLGPTFRRFGGAKAP